MRTRLVLLAAAAALLAVPAIASPPRAPLADKGPQSPWVHTIACSPTEAQACRKCVLDGGSPDTCKTCAPCRK